MSWRKKKKVKVLVAQSCPALWDPMDCSPPGSSVHRVLQARILKRVVTPFSRGSSRPRDQSQVSCTAGRFFTIWATREAKQLATGEGYSKRRELHVQRSAEELEMEGQRGYTGSGEEGNGMRGRESFLEVLAQFTKYVTSCLCPDAA